MNKLTRIIGIMPKAPRVYSTWDPANKNPATELSNSNLTLGKNANVLWSQGLATQGKTSGGWCFTIKKSSTTVNTIVGVSSYLKTGSGENYVGSGVTGERAVGYNSTGTIHRAGSVIATVASWLSTDTIQIEFNATTGAVYFYKNGTQVYTINLGAGILYPAASAYSIVDSVTANFGQTTSITPNNSGFNAGVFN